jgi:hypothetical protein
VRRPTITIKSTKSGDNGEEETCLFEDKSIA